MEQGKDVLAIDPDGKPCAFQLKCPGHRLGLAQWADLLPQITRLVELPITHPSIDESLPRRAILAINGELEEEVRQEIADRNRQWEDRNLPRLEVMVRGDILAGFKELQSDFWPTPLEFEQDLLQLYLQDGKCNLDKTKFTRFLDRILRSDEAIASPRTFARRTASAAAFTSYALSAFAKESNHVALFEGWTIFMASLIAFAATAGVEDQHLSEAFWIPLETALSALNCLLDELRARPHYVEGNAFVDGPFWAARLTWLCSLMAALALHSVSIAPDWPHLEWIASFVSSNIKNLHFWGEAATPQFLAIFWFLTLTRPPKESISLLWTLLNAICARNTLETLPDIPDPYHDFAEVVEYDLGIKRTQEREHFRGRSYSLETILHLIARRGWRQSLSRLWPKISRIAFAAYLPNCAADYCAWNTERGNLTVRYPQTPQSWSELLAQSRRSDCTFVPRQLLSRPTFLLFFLIVFPHRLNADVAKYLDDCAGDIVSRAKSYKVDAA